MFDTMSVLSVQNLVVRYKRRGLFGPKPAPSVNNVSFELRKGATLGLVGESGSGKSTLLRAILRLVAVESGAIHLEGQDWLAMSEREMRATRARIGIVPQNPFLSLSPRLSVAEILAEPMLAAGGFSGGEVHNRSEELLAICGLPESYLFRRAHHLSGGQSQRVAIARSLMLRPQFVILDEPTSALDISVQAQILNLLQDLKKQMNLSILIVTHDLDVARFLADDLLVMRRGVSVESGKAEDVCRAPKDPYTKELMGL